MLGKRKRDHVAVPRPSLHEVEVEKAANATDTADLFRQHFEAHFEPLPQELSLPREAPEQEDELEHEALSETSDWSGIAETNNNVEKVQVIEHTAASEVTVESGDPEGKYFMSSKPPSVGKAIPTPKVTRPAETKEDVMDAANLQNDLALQRLLKESHLLDRSNLSAPPSLNRDKVTDLRVQSLGAKTSLFAQQKMPLAHRRGIKAKAAMREEVRRKEAQENGVILEKASKGKQSETRRRDRGIGTPGVGKFAGGTLKLSRKDIHEINGPRQAARGRRKGRR